MQNLHYIVQYTEEPKFVKYFLYFPKKGKTVFDLNNGKNIFCCISSFLAFFKSKNAFPAVTVFKKAYYFVVADFRVTF